MKTKNNMTRADKVHAVFPDHQDFFKESKYTGLIDAVSSGNPFARMAVRSMGSRRNAWEATAMIVNQISASISEPLYTRVYSF